MSARSAYARKKTTQAKNQDPVKHGRAQSVATSSSGEDIYGDMSIPPNIVTSAMRYPLQTSQNGAATLGSRGDGTPRGRPMMSPDWNMDAYASNQVTSPTEDWVHNRSRRATLPEEHGYVERSGLRTIIDKRSDDVRKTIAKTFTFRRKEKEEEPIEQDETNSRPSADTVQPRIIPTRTESHTWDTQSSARTDTTLASTASYTSSQYLQPPSPNPLLSCSIPPAGPPPTSKLPPIPQTSAASTSHIKRWCGRGRPITKWNKLRKDPELWDPNGDVLIFLGRKGQGLPALRVSSHIIEATNSRYLLNLLDEGSLGEYVQSPPSPRSDSYGMRLGHEFQDTPLTPPASGRTSIGDIGGQISYEMHFPPPQNVKSIDQLRHQITTRNVFALLLNTSIVGLSLHEALADLHVRLDSYMPPNNDNVRQITRYIYNRELDDVRSSPSMALSLLLWAEEPDVRWEDGWRECFTHCVGMYELVQKYKDFKCLSPNTRQLMETASHEMQNRVRAAEDRLAGFRYQDIWTSSPTIGPEMRAIDRTKDMLLRHFEQEYGSWPPAPSAQSDCRPESSANATGSDTWLSRTVVMRLQRDFGTLYDCLVDRDMVWGVLELQHRSQLMMVSKSNHKVLDVDADGLPLTDMLIEFDNKYRFPHLPHPYPLLPKSTSSTSAGHSFRKEGRKAKDDQISALERRIQLAYKVSFNDGELDFQSSENKLVEAFERFEKNDEIGDMSPATARRSRWILIYGVLQSLASVSVDDKRVQHSDKVDYHLSPRLEGVRIPPWKRGMSEGIGEGAHERSYCWTTETEAEANKDEYPDDVDIDILDLPIQMNTPGAVMDRNTGLRESFGTGISPGLKERIRRDRENESPVAADYLYT
ncbi:hypothetical protein QYS62_006224 [Fusarium acuminatum]|uniref:DUF8004 domain-containing protein n=1 Tax=Fusarium acuminatum TaxID=5515 RepID=A0ABZ2WYZ7_9HYPO